MAEVNLRVIFYERNVVWAIGRCGDNVSLWVAAIGDTFEQIADQNSTFIFNAPDEVVDIFRKATGNVEIR